MSLRPRRLAALPAAALTAVVSATTLLPTPATAATANRYVALGDSYSAGNGTAASTNDCYQSPYAYPALVAASTGWVLDQRACSGATVSDVVATQVGAVGADAAVVSVSAGGNDAGFAPGLAECALPGWMSNCTAKLDAAAALVNGTIPQRLDGLYGQLATRAPQARRLAVLYPHIFQGTDCSVLTFFSPAEQARINQLTDTLDDLTAARARAHGMTVVDPRGSFTGHAWCDTAQWINGPALPVADAYHPNRAGNRGYADAVLAATGQGGTTTAAGTMTASGTPTVRRQPTTADYARVAPGLASPTNLALGQRAGFSRRELVRLDRDLRSRDLRRQQRAVARLQQLEARWQAAQR